MRNPLPPTLAAALLLAAPPVLAQSFSGIVPSRAFVLPQPGDAPRPAEAPAPTPGSAPAAAEADPVNRLPSIAAPLRLWGENAEVGWTMYVTDAEARGGGSLRLGYLSAVSVLPDASSLTLTVNGTRIGSAPVDGARGLRTLAFDIPPGLLVHGFNAVRVSGEQRHRVDCSVEATYELWTQIDAETSGFVPSVKAPPLSPADLAAVRIAADGSVPLRLIQTGDRLSERVVERLIGALQDVVLAGRFAQPAADFGPAAEPGDGLALAVGTTEALAKAVDLASLGPVTGPRLALLPGTAAQRPVLVATGLSESDVAEALSQLARLRADRPAGSPEGLRALADAAGRRIEGGETVTLADLGLADAHVVAATHRILFDLALPHDFLPADYAKLSLDLDGSYPGGLAPGAQIVVDINGINAASAPLGRSGGESLRHRSVFLPLRLLRPGLNQIAITAQLPRAGDRACEARDSGAEIERMTLLSSTRLTVPPLARIGRQPELAETLSAGYPYAEPGRRTTLSVPAPDRDTMAAAATLAARLGLAAGRPIPFLFAAGRSTGASGPTVVVSPFRALDASVASAAGLDVASLREAWGAREATSPEPASALRRGHLARDAIAACRGRRMPGEATMGDGATAPAADPRTASAILAQATTGPGRDDLLTLVTAPNSAGLDEAVDCLMHPRVWHRARGRLATIAAADGTVASLDAEAPRYVATAAPSVMNLRRIAAGWLSLHASFYGIFAVLLAACLAGSTHVLVRSLGRRSQ